MCLEIRPNKYKKPPEEAEFTAEGRLIAWKVLERWMVAPHKVGWYAPYRSHPYTSGHVESNRPGWGKPAGRLSRSERYGVVAIGLHAFLLESDAISLAKERVIISPASVYGVFKVEAEPKAILAYGVFGLAPSVVMHSLRIDLSSPSGMYTRPLAG